MIVLLFSIQIPSAEAATLEGETTVNLNVRATPSTNGKLIQTLKKGTKVKYGTHNKEWSKIYLNSRTYYASAQYIKRITAPATTVTKQTATSTGVTTVNLNIRVSAYSKAKIYRTLKKGTTVQYVVHNSSWAKVYVDGKTYYAAKAYIAPKTVASQPTVVKEDGHANRELKLFGYRNQRSTVLKVLPAQTAVVSSKYNSSWSVVYIGSKTYYAPTAFITAGAAKPTVVKENGHANRELKLFGYRNQRSTVLKVLPAQTAVVSSKYNSSWSIVYIGSKTYYAPTAFISPGAPAVTPPPATKPPVVQKVTGYANRNANLYKKTIQSSPVARVLPKYTAVTYSKHNSSWSVVYIGTETFYTPTSWLSAGKAPAAPAATPKGKVYTNTPGDVLNVRASASASSTILGRLAHGTQVDHYGSTNGFYKIKYNGRDGYISTAYAMTLKPSATSNAVIVLDAGHGGGDPGAVNGSLYEKTVVLDVTKRVEAYLRSKYDYQVRLTRSTDVYLTLDQRVQTAKTLRGNLFVSLHTNAATTPYAKGVETFYSSSSAHSAKSRVLATDIQSHLMGKMSGMTNRGVKTANYYVIRYNTMPSALVELGFISSPQDITHLRSDASRQRMAEGVAEGIAKYVRAYH
ncbi:N-acetylmuramoyl-L-alanine amidase [Exiguobacterium aurantiacum]|uniref:N-acetylmuramoyl-L-alanine amidase n=1 Tax=Exiguobacterium aurantiacum TaxID=33987 RepID=A0ABY5FSB5_9BACL|nr:N-acetylmuramoyl-L-alanine amidase [Exiguobacterium aurantiacum]UTT44451.1 N-acetylmuramoyl-L-alanine amidase [Exiguobacterium aurantiacum]